MPPHLLPQATPLRHARPWLALLALGTLWLLLGLLLGGTAPSKAETPAARTAWVLTIDGAIGPASADYVQRGLARAHEQGAAAVVLQMDTPGGLDTSMREIIRAVLASPVPVLSWVGPSGARAASAGTYILYASPVAAMAPGTNLGAATPVQIGGGGGLPMPGRTPSEDTQRPAGGGEAEGGSEAPAPAADTGANADTQAQPAPGATPPRTAPRRPAGGGSASEAKLLNDAIAYIRSLAALHGRNADWAEEAVRDAASLSAEAALERGVIDLVATSVPDLLKQAHGREVRLGEARLTLNTADLQIQTHAPDWRARMLGVITNPNLALILMLVGVYGLIFEFMNPGALVPGTVGAISLLLGLYALSALPVNYVGVLLLLLGVALMVAEAFSPSFGILGLGGVVAFVFGGTLLFDGEAPGYDVSLGLLGGVALASLGLTLLIVRLALKARRAHAVTGGHALVGETARVLDWQDGEGHVFVAGERWQADGPDALLPGQKVRVAAVHGLRVSVQALALADPTRLDPAA
jgi:membrane-bound serine protease (ClpP class)